MASPSAVLALDLGTSSCKAAAYTSAGEANESAAIRYGTYSSQAGYVEQDPEEYVRATDAVSGFDCVAICFSTQTPTLVFCDERGQSLRPAIVWQDSRATQEAEFLLRSTTAEQRREWFGMDLPISAASTPAKLLWVARHEPEVWKQTRYVVQPKDYVAARLTGEFATDAWCNKGVAHLETGEIHPEWAALLGRTDSFTAPVLESTSVVGRTARGTPVVVGLSDALSGIFSTGATLRDRRGFVITGTSEIVGVGRAGGRLHPGLFVAPGGLHFGPTQAGAAALEWLARLTNRTVTELLDALPENLHPSPILFRPHLAGERAPYWDHSLTGSFEGLRMEHGPAEIALAVLQGVALQERLVLTCAEGGVAVDDVVIGGGGARDGKWNQIRANVLQRRVLVMRDVEASLRGAALVGWAGCGELKLSRVPESWFSFDEVAPDPSWSEAVDALFARFVQPGFAL